MSKQEPRHWVGHLTDEHYGGLVLYDRQSPDRSPNEVYLYHYSTNKIINHFKHSVKARLRPLDNHEMRQVDKVKSAYLEYKLRYFQHYMQFIESRYAHTFPPEFIYLSYTMGGAPWESFRGDPDWELVNQIG